MKKESSKRMKLQSGEKYGTIYSRKLKGGGEKYKEPFQNLKEDANHSLNQEHFFVFQYTEIILSISLTTGDTKLETKIPQPLVENRTLPSSGHNQLHRACIIKLVNICSCDWI